MEINPGHPLLAKMQGLFEADAEGAVLGEYAQLLHGQALLTEGSVLPDPMGFSKLIAELMVRA